MKFVVKRVALVFQQLGVRLAVAVQDHAHPPRPGEHLWILDRHVIREVIAIERRVAARPDVDPTRLASLNSLSTEPPVLVAGPW